MKQTNNALKFLLAQYRAVFKNAYFKGIASAVVLTAGLAAGQSAQAAAFSASDWTSLDQNKTISGTNTGVGFQISGDATNSSSEAITVEFTGGDISSGVNKISTNSADTTVKGDKVTIHLNIANDATKGLSIEGGASNKALLDINAFEITKGTLLLSGGDAAAKGATLDANTITLKGAAASDAIIQFKGTGADAAVIDGLLKTETGKAGTLDFTAGSGTIKAHTGTDSANISINVGSGATAVLDLTAGQTFKTNGTIALGDSNGSGTFTVKTGILALGANSAANIGTGADNNGAVNVESGAFINNEGTVTLGGTTREGTLTVKDGANFTNTGSVTVTSGSLANSGTVTNDGTVTLGGAATSGTLTVDSKATLTSNGTLNIGASGALTNSGDVTIAEGTLTNAGTLTVDSVDSTATENASLTVAEGATLALTSATTTITKGTLTIDDGATLTATADTAKITLNDAAAVLNISAETLDSFLTEDKIGNATENDKAGKVKLTQGTIEINDTDADNPTDLAHENLDLSAGNVNGDFLAVSTTLTGASDLNILARDTLTLGGGKVSDTENFKSAEQALGFGSATTRNIVFKADAGTNKDFTLQDDIVLSAVDTNEEDGSTTASTGTITGNVIINDGKITVKDGSYAASNKITLANGEISVGQADPNSTLQASLDLSSAEVTIGKDYVTAFNINQLGTLTINDKTAAEIVKSGSQNITKINAGGTLNINGNVTAAASTFAEGGTTGAHFLFNGAANTTDVNNEAHLNIDGDLSLTGAASAVSIGEYAFLQANNWQIEGTGGTATTAGKASFGAGNYTVLGSLATARSQDTDLTLADKARFTFGSDNSTGGDIAANLVLDSGSQANVLAGTWTARNMTVNAGGKLNIGLDAKDAAATTVNAGRYTLTVAGGAAHVSENAEARFEGLNVSNNGSLDVSGQMTVSGKYVAEEKDAKGKVTTPANWGVNLATGSKIDVHGAKANLTFGSEVLKSLQTKADAEDETKTNLALLVSFKSVAPLGKGILNLFCGQ